jgi:ABC-type multidrug transport system ATPase subunit
VARRDLWNLLFDLSAQGVTFFVTTHYMDEAERCSHLGYIYYARLMAYGTPNDLKALPEVTPEGTTRYEVRVQRVARAMQHLNNMHFVQDATIFGDALHVLAESGSEKALRDTLEKADFGDAAVREIPATLEDVFVTLTRLRAAERARG